jgi:glycosyltransferase involved in cell wall biosynthesis
MLIPHAGAGGDWKMTLELIAYLASKGHDVTLGGHMSPSNGDGRYRVMPLPLNKGPLGVIKSIRAFRFEDDQYDVIHAHAPIAALLGIYVRRRCGGKLIWTCHWPTPDGRLRRRIKARVFRRLDLVHSVSEEVTEFLCSRYGLPDRLVHTIEVGCSPARFYPGSQDEKLARRDEYGIDRDAIALGFVGRLDREKNLPYVFRYLARHRDDRPGLRFVVAGDGPLRQEWGDLVKFLRVEDRVKFLGRVADARHVYVLSDLLVLPSRFEGCPAVVVEAFLCGLPVLRSDGGGCRAQIIPGKTGAHFATGDEDKFELELTQLLRKAGQLEEMGRHAHAFALDRFTDEVMFAKIERMYHQVLGGQSPTRLAAQCTS